MGDVEYGMIYDIYFPPAKSNLFNGPSSSVVDMWRILAHGTTDDGLVAVTFSTENSRLMGVNENPGGS